MNTYFRRTIACTLCATLLGAELYLHKLECRAPKCVPVDLTHAPTREPGSGNRWPTVLATGTGSSTSSGEVMFASPIRPPTT
jgi:phage FluMu protein Com